ncbi:MAG: hypothetical protein JXP34_00760, partial [Planctomycetes bacterium]|nr:hypothetical protein [Planctomycetota bacterium]
DWQIGYRYRNGRFISEKGQLWGIDTAGTRLPIVSPNPKVFLPVGNCLIGHIDGPDAMALAYMNAAGVRQMIGYTVPTWYGYAGWGCLDFFVEQPGRTTFAEAFLANHHALVHRLTTYFPEIAKDEPPPGRTVRPPALSDAARAAGLSVMDGQGLLHDRDVLAFYGDPGWIARMADGPRAWEQSLCIEEGDRYVFEIRPNRGARTFEPVNRNGSQRGGRPIIAFLPHRIRDVEILEGEDLRPVIADDFILVPNPGGEDPCPAYRVVFRARRTDPEPAARRNGPVATLQCATRR